MFTKPTSLMLPYFVYILKNLDGLPFYVGYSVTNRSDNGFRPNDHIRDAMLIPKGRIGNCHKRNTIKKILDNGELPLLTIAGQYETKEEAFAKEMELIEQYGRRCNSTGILTNLVKGGSGGNNWDSYAPDKQAEIRAKMRKKIVSDDTKKKISEANKNRVHSKESIAKRVSKIVGTGKCSNKGEKNGMYGRKHSQQAKDAVSLANSGRLQSQEEKDIRAESLRKAYVLKNESLYRRIMQLLDSGKKCKDIVSELKVSSDTVTKLRKPERRAYIMKILEDQI